MFKCEFCDKEFKVERGLKNHKNKFHAELLNYTYHCEICGKGAEDLGGLLTHVTKIHKDIGAKLYYETYLYGTIRCKYCDELLPYKRYSGNYCNQQHYESYMRRDVINVKCVLCGTGFENVGGLQQHLGKMHKDVDQVDYYRTHIMKSDEPDGKCLTCGADVSLDSFTHGFNKFCYNKDCNVLWYNQHTDRKERAAETLSTTYKNDKSLLPTNNAYWVKRGLTEEEATKKVSERQTTFSKEICIEKYGKVEGLKRWKDRQDKWQNTINSKSDEEINRINRLKASYGVNVSKAERDLCQILECESAFIISREKGYVYDMRRGNKLIEYYGDYWHCNPKIYDKDYYNRRIAKTASEKWKSDQDKNDYAMRNGFSVMVVWEKDYNTDPQKVINECLEFLK